MNSKKFECALGIHEYTIPHKDEFKLNIKICKHCRKHGYHKGDNGYECWVEYNKTKRETHFKSNRGYEYWYKYDENGNKIHFKSNNGYEKWFKYDDKGNMIHFKDNEGNESWLHKGEWVHNKPENWGHENTIKGKISECI